MAAAVGSNVNLAGRIESFTTGGQVLISEPTRQKLQAPLRVDNQFKVEPKSASAGLKFFEAGGLGAPFNLSLPSKTTPLQTLSNPLPIQFTVAASISPRSPPTSKPGCVTCPPLVNFPP